MVLVIKLVASSSINPASQLRVTVLVPSLVNWKSADPLASTLKAIPFVTVMHIDCPVLMAFPLRLPLPLTTFPQTLSLEGSGATQEAFTLNGKGFLNSVVYPAPIVMVFLMASILSVTNMLAVHVNVTSESPLF